MPLQSSDCLLHHNTFPGTQHNPHIQAWFPQLKQWVQLKLTRTYSPTESRLVLESEQCLQLCLNYLKLWLNLFNQAREQLRRNFSAQASWSWHKISLSILHGQPASGAGESLSRIS